ncbi:ATP synthase subunit b [Thalassoporum mexicanum PCC 7367]|uniref:F0F1 ATP synthase subunit B n=1 Tax=Thalassoporum mexicanum TaxID=3457544 RepID=UPI00029FE278|nr:F0F1 ATP synthase subunit B [Pseudanabaena sp. PCC 7367]AFY70564.1 ATP synthase subunit b [Pseudanabaena sp. PCC 7367]
MFTSLFLLASEAGEAEGFGINTNIFETNIINIVIILAFLIYAGRGFIGNILSSRLQTIESAINDAEKRKKESIEKLSDQQEKLAQAQAERDRILAQAQSDAKAAREAILKDIDAEIAKLQAAGEQEIGSEQERIISQLRQQVVDKAIADASAYFERGLSEHVQQQLVDRSIDLISAE